MDEKLIEAVKTHPELYDLKNPLYKNNKYKNDVWKSINDDLNITDAKELWFRLRDQFRDAVNRRKKKSGQAATAFPKWKYSDQMAFLLECSSKGPTVSNLDTTSEVDSIESQESFSDSPGSSQQPPGNTRGKRKANAVVDYLEKNAKFREERREELLKLIEPPKEDPISIFFDAMKVQTLKLPRMAQLRIKRVLFEKVMEEEEQLEQSNNTNSDGAVDNDMLE